MEKPEHFFFHDSAIAKGGGLLEEGSLTPVFLSCYKRRKAGATAERHLCFWMQHMTE